MCQLDDRAFVERLDPSGMYRLTVEFPDQCRRALDIARNVTLPSAFGTVQNVVLSGLGGSAAGGDFTRALFESTGSVPFAVNREYAMPNYVGPGTLVFATSYSGNTEETLSAYQDAKARGAKIVVVTGGGKLAALAEGDGFPLIQIPAGQPPRTALGYLFVPVAQACVQLGLLPDPGFEEAFSVLDRCVVDWSVETPFDSNDPKQLAKALQGALSVIYGLGPWQSLVANRWKGQINENAKNMTFANAFPELCHNEILGWVKADGQGVEKWVQIVLQDGSESAKMKARASVTGDLTKDVCSVYNVRAVGESLLSRIMSLTLYGDFVSIYLAALNGVDPENIDSINVLKSELSKIP